MAGCVMTPQESGQRDYQAPITVSIAETAHDNTVTISITINAAPTREYDSEQTITPSVDADVSVVP